ncbi:MAG TPA: DUF948 domain-containing protein [Mycobacteriales bacterium]|nr:DUF948 domain-containing protein [Mycobacteriales bacterium]
MLIQASGGLSGGQVAGLIVAVFWGVLVCFLAYVLVKLGKVIGEAAKLVAGVADQTVPLLGEVTTSVVQVNAELTRVDAIASNVEEISTNARAMSSLFSATLGSPMIKVAAFSYGVRKAMKQRDEADVRDAVKREMKLQRAARRADRKAG